MLNKLITKVYAQTGEIGATLEEKSIKGLVTWITDWLIGIGLGVTVIMIALAFIGFATSRGDEEKTKNAQNWLTYAVIGGVGLFLVYVLKTIILSIAGVAEPYTYTQTFGGE